MKLSETKKLLAMLRAQYQHRFVIDEMTEVVWHGLLNEPPELPTQAVYDAAMAWMRDNEWPPQVKDLRDIIAERVCGIPDADAAWTHLWAWLKAGYPGIPDNRPPLPELIAQAVREVGGTSMVRNGEVKRETFDRAYNRLRRQQVASVNVTEKYAEMGRGQRDALSDVTISVLPIGEGE